jgi:hypothetical protein
MALTRLGIANPDPNTATLIFTSDGDYLASVLVTNGNTANGSTTIYIDPEGAGVEANFVYITKNLIVETGNSVEVHRFALVENDLLYVSGSREGFSFLAEGIQQTDLLAYSPKQLLTRTDAGASHTLEFEDIDRLLKLTNASTITLTVPNETINPAPIGSRFYIYGTQAAVSVNAGDGVTVNKNAGATLVSDGAYSVIQLIKTNPNEYLLFGELNRI